jgi:hypothetical protein
VKDTWKQQEIILNNMKVKDLIELLEEENPKAKVIFEFEDQELTVDELGIESGDLIVVIKLLEK